MLVGIQISLWQGAKALASREPRRFPESPDAGSKGDDEGRGEGSKPVEVHGDRWNLSLPAKPDEDAHCSGNDEIVPPSTFLLLFAKFVPGVLSQDKVVIKVVAVALTEKRVVRGRTLTLSGDR